MEFKVSDRITLKLAYGNTSIYVDGKRFNTCKRLVLEIHADDIPEYDEIDSIDEASAKHATLRYGKVIGVKEVKISITPEEEFWAHCSNLQAWVESGYDSRLLHSNLAFPLLWELARSGEPAAVRNFNEEVKARLCSGFKPTVEYLLQSGFASMLGKSDWLEIFQRLPDRKNVSNFVIYLVLHSRKECVPVALLEQYSGLLKRYTPEFFP